MSRLLPADSASVPTHILVYIVVTYSSLGITYSLLIECLIQTEVGHYGSYNCIVLKLAPLLHIPSIYVEDVVTCDDISLLIDTETSVRIAIIGKAHVKSILNH